MDNKNKRYTLDENSHPHLRIDPQVLDAISVDAIFGVQWNNASNDDERKHILGNYIYAQHKDAIVNFFNGVETDGVISRANILIPFATSGGLDTDLSLVTPEPEPIAPEPEPEAPEPEPEAPEPEPEAEAPEPPTSSNLVEFRITQVDGVERVQLKCASSVEGLAGMTLNFNKAYGVSNAYDGTNVTYGAGPPTGVSLLGQVAVAGGWVINLGATQIQTFTGGSGYLGSDEWEDLIIFPTDTGVSFSGTQECSYVVGGTSIQGNLTTDASGKVTVLSSSSLVNSLRKRNQEYIVGDLDGNGSAGEINDVVLIARYNSKKNYDTSGLPVWVADFDGNGNAAEINDVVILARYNSVKAAGGIPDPLPEQPTGYQELDHNEQNIAGGRNVHLWLDGEEINL